MNKKRFDELFLRYYWKMLVALGYLTFLIIFFIMRIYAYELGILEFTFFTLFYVACTWQIFIEGGD